MDVVFLSVIQYNILQQLLLLTSGFFSKLFFNTITYFDDWFFGNHIHYHKVNIAEFFNISLSPDDFSKTECSVFVWSTLEPLKCRFF